MGSRDLDAERSVGEAGINDAAEEEEEQQGDESRR